MSPQMRILLAASTLAAHALCSAQGLEVTVGGQAFAGQSFAALAAVNTAAAPLPAASAPQADDGTADARYAVRATERNHLPEPGTAGLVLAGLAAVGFVARRSIKNGD